MELWDIYDENGRPTGRTHPRGAPMQPGEYHLACTVVLINKKGEVLCTRRAPEKELCPGMWESPGGGVQAGESSLSAAVRELGEETGLALEPGQLALLYRDKRPDFFMDVFGGHMDFPAESLHLQPGETDGAKWIPLDAWEEMARAGEILTPAKGEFFSILRGFAHTLRWPQDSPSPALRQKILALQATAWPELAGDPWPEGDHMASFCWMEGEEPLAHAAVMGRGIKYKGEGYFACGIGEVVTRPDARGRGLALQVLRQAERFIRGSGADLCLFTCKPELAALYGKAGWEARPGLCLVGGSQEEPFPSSSLGLTAMVGLYSQKALAHQEDFAQGEVFLGLGAGRLW